MTRYVPGSDPFHYGQHLQDEKEILRAKKIDHHLPRKHHCPRITHHPHHQDDIKELTRRLKELQRTDSALSGQSSKTKDSGFNSEAPSSFAEQNSDVPIFIGDARFPETSGLRSSLSLGTLPQENDSPFPQKLELSQFQELPPTPKPLAPPPPAPEEPSSSKRKVRKLEDGKQATIRQHYYPEGGWGYVVMVVGTLVQMLTHGLQLSFGYFLLFVVRKWGRSPEFDFWKAELLGSLCMSTSLIISPITIAVCRRKSTRLTAVIGGLVISLGILFSSFAKQFHQLYFSFGIFTAVGVGMTRDTSTLMLGQYFKRKREFVEIFLLGGSGIGISVMSLYFQDSMITIGWRLGLQALTGVLFLNFFLGTFYRSASLYHPQRRAILHLKTQKRKIKSKAGAHVNPAKIQAYQSSSSPEEKLPFLDFGTLRSRTVQIILVSTGAASFGIFAPLFLLARQAQYERIDLDSILKLQIFMGISWVLGCLGFGLIVVNNSVECRISRQYLCQASLIMISLSIISLTIIRGYNAYVIFVWIYGIFLGGYNYSIKMYVYEKVRARNFARAWGFVQFVMGLPNLFGIPIIGYLNVFNQDKDKTSSAGYYLSGGCVLIGSLLLVLIDLHKNQLRKKRANATNVVETSNLTRKNSNLTELPKIELEGNPNENFINEGSFVENIINDDDDEDECDDDLEDLDEGIHEREEIDEDDEFDDIIPEDLIFYGIEKDDDDELIDDNISSCNKVENVVILSELEQNLIVKSLEDRSRLFSDIEEVSKGNNTANNNRKLPHHHHHHHHKRLSDLEDCKHELLNTVIEEESSL